MLTTIYFQKLWVSEFIQFLKDLISICRKNDAAALNIETRLQPVEDTVNKLDLMFKQEQGSDLTKEIAALDKRRDAALVSLTSLIKGFTYHFEEARCQAAEKLKSVVDRYGNSIYDLNYQAETTTVTNLVTDLETDAEAAVAVNTLGLQPLLNELKTANTQFNEKYLARIDEKSELPDDSMLELRKTAVMQFRDLVNMIEAYVVIDGPDKYLPLIKKLNELIEKYNETIAFRNGKGEAKSEEEGAI